MQAVVLADGEDFGQRNLSALLEGLFREALDTHDVALGDAYLLAPGPDHCVHGFPSTSRANRPPKIPDGDSPVKAASVLADLVRQLVRVRRPRLREEEGEGVAEPVHRAHDAFRELSFGEEGPRRVPGPGPERVADFFVDSGPADHSEGARLRGYEDEASRAPDRLVHAELQEG